MKQPKFNIGDSFETTYLPEGKNITLVIEGINYTKECYYLVNKDQFSMTGDFDFDEVDKYITRGSFLLVEDFPSIEEEEQGEGLPLTQEYIDCYQEQEFHCYNPELDFTRDEGNRYTLEGLDDDELLEVSAWVNTPKDAVNNFLDKMMRGW